MQVQPFQASTLCCHLQLEQTKPKGLLFDWAYSVVKKSEHWGGREFKVCKPLCFAVPYPGACIKFYEKMRGLNPSKRL